MVYEMFSKGFIIVVVVVAFIAFIILMEGSAREHWFSSKPPGSANMLLFNQRRKTQNSPEMLDCGYMLKTPHGHTVGMFTGRMGNASEATFKSCETEILK